VATDYRVIWWVVALVLIVVALGGLFVVVG